MKVAKDAFIIDISDLTGQSPVPSVFFKKLILRVLKKEKIRRATLSLLLVSDSFIRRLNKKFLARDRATDVLAFDLEDKEMPRHHLAGDIAVSLDTARATSRVFKISVEEELCRYVVHGILHLAGYDDRSSFKKRQMWKRQEELLKETR